jgi:hypothetical protein
MKKIQGLGPVQRDYVRDLYNNHFELLRGMHDTNCSSRPIEIACSANLDLAVGKLMDI